MPALQRTMEHDMRDELHVCEDADALAKHACEWLIGLMSAHQGPAPFTLALSGGSTPQRLYHQLAQASSGDVDWHNVLLLWGDERNVASDDTESNFRMVREALLDHIDIPLENILSVPQSEGPAEQVGESYEQLLRERFPTDEAFPRIDCVLLGLGVDIHTASLFPGTVALGEKNRWFMANHVPQLDSWRLTITAPLINAAKNVAFLLSGASKRDALSKLWHATLDPNLYPAQLVRPTAGKLWYLLDKAALGQTQLPESVRTQIVSH